MAIDITAQNVRDYLEGFGIAVADSVVTDAWILARISNFIVPVVEKHVRASFDGTTQFTDYYSGNGENVLILRRKNLDSVDSITMVGSTLTYNSSAYEIDLSNGIIKLKALLSEGETVKGFPKGSNNIKVVYTGGYSNADLPVDIREAITMLAAEVVLGNIANRTGGGNVSTQGFNRNFGERGKYTMMRDDLKRQAYALLAKYTRGIA